MPGALTRRGSPRNRKVNIADTATAGTEVVNLEGATSGSVFADTSFDGSAITFQSAMSGKLNGVPLNEQTAGTGWVWFTAKDGAGNNISVSVSAGQSAPLPSSLFGLRYIRPVSGTAQTGAGFVTFVLS